MDVLQVVLSQVFIDRLITIGCTAAPIIITFIIREKARNKKFLKRKEFEGFQKLNEKKITDMGIEIKDLIGIEIKNLHERYDELETLTINSNNNIVNLSQHMTNTLDNFRLRQEDLNKKTQDEEREKLTKFIADKITESMKDQFNKLFNIPSVKKKLNKPKTR